MRCRPWQLVAPVLQYLGIRRGGSCAAQYHSEPKIQLLDEGTACIAISLLTHVLLELLQFLHSHRVSLGNHWDQIHPIVQGSHELDI